MPYKLRKVPKKDLYWVVAEDGEHMSKEGLPKDKAEAQMRALYASMHDKEEEVPATGAGMPKGNKNAGFVGLMIAKKHLGRTPDSYKPPATEKSTPAMFDQDRIAKPSKYIQNNLYEHSTKIRTAMQKVKDIRSKHIVKSAVKKHVIAWKDRAVGAMGMTSPDELKDFVQSYKRGGVQGIAYSAYSITGEMMFIHLMRKYKNDCYIVYRDKKRGIYISGIDITENGNPNRMTDVHDLARSFKDCLDINTPLIIIPLTMPGHQNMMLYRPTLNTIERFEPHGEKSGHLSKAQNDKMDENLKHFFMKKDFANVFQRAGVPEFKYLKPQDLKSGLGFQGVENMEMFKIERETGRKLGYRGFCQMWAFFYLELCMRYPKLTGKEVIDKAFDAINSKEGTNKWLTHIGAYVEDSEKEIKKLVAEFSFAQLSAAKGEAAVKIIRSYYDWFNEQIRVIVLARQTRISDREAAAPPPPPATKGKKKGKGYICTCKGGGDCGTTCTCPSHTLQGGSIDLERYAQWAARVPLSEEKWIENRKIFSPETATHENYLKMYLEPFNKAPGLMSYKFVPGVDKGQPCPDDAVVVRGSEDIAKLPPGTRYCQPNPADGSISMGTTKTEGELAYYDEERRQMEEMKARQRQEAEDKYWEKQGAVSKFFNKDVVGALTKVADVGTQFISKIVPGPLGKILPAVYQNFAPPGSEYHKQGSFGQKLTGAVVDSAKATVPGVASTASLFGLGHHAHPLHGDGFFSDMWNSAANVGRKIIGRVKDVMKGIRQDYPPAVRKMIAEIGNVPIRSMLVRRDPLPKPLETALDLLTIGKWTLAKANADYDKLFHLCIEFKLSTGASYVLEKNEVINVGKPLAYSTDTETRRVPMETATLNTLNGLLSNGQRRMGPNWFIYDAFSSNCQDFVFNVLLANNQMTPQLEAFIKQPLEKVLEALPSWAPRIGRVMTDLGAAADVAMHGRGWAIKSEPSARFGKQLKELGISPEAYLKVARKKMGDTALRNWVHLGFSDDATHKLQVPNESGKLIRFGSAGMGDHILYTLTKSPDADKHRKAYRARATKIKGDWKKDPYSPNNLAIEVLW